MAAFETINTTTEQDLHDFEGIKETKNGVDISKQMEDLLNKIEEGIENKDRILYAFSHFDENDTKEFTSILEESMKLEKPITA